MEALKKLLNGEISARTRTNIVRQDEFSSRLEQAIARYHNRSVDAIQVLQELIQIAKDLQKEPEDGLTSATAHHPREQAKKLFPSRDFH